MKTQQICRHQELLDPGAPTRLPGQSISAHLIVLCCCGHYPKTACGRRRMGSSSSPKPYWASLEGAVCGVLMSMSVLLCQQYQKNPNVKKKFHSMALVLDDHMFLPNQLLHLGECDVLIERLESRDHLWTRGGGLLSLMHELRVGWGWGVLIPPTWR